MADQPVFIFGSFTEDETRQFQGKPTEKSEHVESVKLRFGSFDFVSLNLVEGSGSRAKRIDISVKSKGTEVPKLATHGRAGTNGKTSESNAVRSTSGAQSNGSTRICTTLDSVVVKKETEAPKFVTNERTCKDGKPPANNLMQSTPLSQSNGSAHLCSPLSDGVMHKENNGPVLGLMNVSETRSSTREILVNPEVHYGVERSKNYDIPNSSSTPIQDSQKISSAHAHQHKTILPRGLMNPGNLCFLNATLQGLLSCSPFVQLLQDLRTLNIPKVGYPTLHAFVKFICNFDTPNDVSVKKNDKRVLETGRSFRPDMFEAILKKFTPNIENHLSGRTRQEDAQEFLSFVMDQMHDELLKLKGNSCNFNGGSSPLISSADDDGWETVGPKNKSAVTRTQSFMPSELSEIFGGQLRSVVKAAGNKASATVQPFLLLHLDVYPQVVQSLEDALHLLSAPEMLEGYRTSAGKAGVVSARRSVKIEKLPKLMILHLMRFGYGSNGSTKLHKSIPFPVDLVLGRELLASPFTEGRRYELVATITHHGKEPSKGHYTADTKYSNSQWLRYDDASVIPVGINKVLHDYAYLLFYKQA